VSLNSEGNIIAIGARENDENGYHSGSMIFYHHIDDEWVEFGNEIFGNAGESFGNSAELNANASRVAVTAPGALDDRGLVRVFTVELSILDHPTNQVNICLGDDVSFSVSATNVNSYQWQESSDGVNNWSNITDDDTYTGSSTNLLTITTNLNLNNYYYRCVLINDTEEIYTNSAKLEFDSEAPIITSLPDTQYIEASAECEVSLPDYRSEVEATDNCDLEIELMQLPPPGTMVSGLGNTISIWAIDDFENATEATFTLDVVDHIAPVIHCGNNQEVNADETQSYLVSGIEFDAVFTHDNCAIASIINDYNDSETLAGELFPVGTSYIVWTITDASGNAMNCSFNVQVNEYNSIEELDMMGISMYPNPVNETLYLEFNKHDTRRIRISDIAGKFLLEKVSNQQKEIIDVLNFDKGVYILEFYIGDKVLRTKFIKR
ncbi:MAG: T9SS type A sorting domain-containing protein, partial [Bacteroidales bacterium]|nr:T9SS type A sorting domain-containing protein [Bacteroidales bacterium]